MKKLQTGFFVTVLGISLLSGCSSPPQNSNSNTENPGAEKVNWKPRFDSVNGALKNIEDSISKNKIVDIKIDNFDLEYKQLINDLEKAHNYNKITSNINNKDTEINNTSSNLKSQLNKYTSGKPQEIKAVEKELVDSGYLMKADTKTDPNSEQALKNLLTREITSLKQQLSNIQEIVNLADTLSNYEKTQASSNESGAGSNNIIVITTIGTIAIIIGVLGFLHYENYRLLETINNKIKQRSPQPAEESETNNQLKAQLIKGQEGISSSGNPVILDSLKNLQNEVTKLNQQFSSGQFAHSLSEQINLLIQQVRTATSQKSNYGTISQKLEQMSDNIKYLEKLINTKRSDVQSDQSQNAVHDDAASSLQIEELQKENQTLQDEKNKLNNELIQLKEEFNNKLHEEKNKLREGLRQELEVNQEPNNKAHEQQYNQLIQEKEEIESRYKKIQDECSDLITQKNKLETEKNNLERRLKESQPPTPAKTEALSSEITQLVEKYNRNPSSLNQHQHVRIEAEVIVDGDSYAKHRKNTTQPMILKKSTSGSSEYIVVSSYIRGTSSYLLFPKEKHISSDQSAAVQTLFNCSGYQKDVTDEFSMIKPAKVSPIGEKSEEWQFKEQDKGELTFS